MPSDWSYLVALVSLTDDETKFPCDAMLHVPSGVTFYMATPLSSYRTPICEYNIHTAKRGRGWSTAKMEARARAEYERLRAAGEIPMRCEFCRTEGRGFIRGLCSDCSLLCWICGEPAAVSEIPSESYRAGDGYALPPSTLCLSCFAESEQEHATRQQAHQQEMDLLGITDGDIPF